jgi:IS5 family transposase
MLEKKALPHTRITVGEDKAYDVAEHVKRLRAKNITPHIAVNDDVTKTGKARKTSLDGRTTRHKGYNFICIPKLLAQRG